MRLCGCLFLFCCLRETAQYKFLKQQMISTDVNIKLYKVRSRLLCAYNCYSISSCLAFFYHPVSKECSELIPSSNPVSNTISDIGWQYLRACEEVDLCFADQTYGVCFCLYQERKTRLDADRHCESVDGRLAIFKSASSHNMIKNKLLERGLSQLIIFVGGDDLVQDGTYMWSDGTLVSGFDWATSPAYGNEPNGGTDENCVTLWCEYDCGLADVRCTDVFPFICEFNI